MRFSKNHHFRHATFQATTSADSDNAACVESVKREENFGEFRQLKVVLKNKHFGNIFPPQETVREREEFKKSRFITRNKNI